MMIRRYSELLKMETLEERFDYLKLSGTVGVDSFGWDRYLNQAFYKSHLWLNVRNQVILRDNGCDLGVESFDISGRILVHHMNPVSKQDILDRNPSIFDPEFLICTSHRTHQAIHYGDKSFLPQIPVVRFPGDTKLW